MRFRLRRMRRDDKGLAAATAEREKSQQRLEAVRAQVIRPLQDKDKHNQFAELIRASLEGGGRR